MTQYSGGLPDDVLKTVGEICVECGHLESTLTNLILLLVAPPPYMQVVQVLVENDSFNAKVDKLRLFAAEAGRLTQSDDAGFTAEHMQIGFAVNRILSAGQRAQLSELVADLDQARIKRNKIVHGTWSTEVERQAEFLRMASSSVGGSVRQTQETWRREDFVSALLQIRDVSNSVTKMFADRLQASFEGWAASTQVETTDDVLGEGADQTNEAVASPPAE